MVTETHSRASSLRVAGRARRTGVGIAAAVTAVVLLAGCATGKDAQTAEETPVVDGVTVTSGTLGIRAAAIQAPQSGTSYQVGEDAPLTLTLINNGTANDTLTGVTATSVSPSVFTGLAGPPATTTATPAAPSATAGSGSATAGSTPSTSASASASDSGSPSVSVTPSQPIPVPSDSAVMVGVGTAGPSIVLTDLTAQLWTAQSVANVVFTFASGATITATLPVQLTNGAGPAPTIDVSPTSEG
ncbi:MAG: hypothetical protein JWO63_3224 [Frankiales bacterium]|nr:hypothetical protein [Frankiales bacterium]